MNIQYPNLNITASELAAVQKTCAYDGIVKLSDFDITVITPEEEAAALGSSVIHVSAGECWIAGRFFKTETPTTVSLPYSDEMQIIKIKCDTTGPIPVAFSIYVSPDEPVHAAGIYEIPIGAIVAGRRVEYNIPLSNGGEFPGVKIYEGDREGFIRVRKISADLVHLKVEVYSIGISGDTRTGCPAFKIPEAYTPEDLCYQMSKRDEINGSGFNFVGWSTEHTFVDGIAHSVFRDWVRFTIHRDGTMATDTTPVAGMSLYGDVVYPIRRK